MFDRGNPESKIVVIGEAPGAEEDKTGLCFVGRAGKMLDWVMASVGLDTNKDMLIANVLKCRPPDNRAPTDKEAAACLPYLTRQIALVKPKLLVLLGNTAVKRLFPEHKKTPMGQLFGKTLTYSQDDLKIPALVLFHPAFLLYDPRKKTQQVEAAKRIPELIK